MKDHPPGTRRRRRRSEDLGRGNAAAAAAAANAEQKGAVKQKYMDTVRSSKGLHVLTDTFVLPSSRSIHDLSLLLNVSLARKWILSYKNSCHSGAQGIKDFIKI